MENQTNQLTTIASALDAPGLWLAVAGRVTPDLFGGELNKLAQVICDLTQDGKPTDVQTVSAAMQARGENCTVGWLLELAQHAPNSGLTLRLAVDGLIEAKKRQAILALINEIGAQARSGEAKTEDILATAVASLTEIGATATNGLQPMAQILHTVINGINRPRTDGIKTGITNLDLVTSGLKPGQLVVLGGRPSMGKTAFALSVVRNAAQTGRTVAVFSLEMTREEVCHRILADLSRVMLAKIATHTLDRNEFTAITAAANAMHKYRIFVGENADNLGGVCRQIKHQHGLDLVVVDYLQLMATRARSREQEIATLSRQLKLLAKQLGCPVLVLSQLNRDLEKRACKRPSMSDLRESGAIEQDADIVLLLWRPGYYDDEADQTAAELIVDKHRNGPIGIVPMTWNKTTATFSGRKIP